MIKNRLSLTFKKEGFTDLKQKVFYTFASLPLSNSNLDKKIQKILLHLKNEGWIEYNKDNNKYQSKFNDTIIDSILQYHFEHNINKKDELYAKISSYFAFGITYNAFGNIIRSFDRIKSYNFCDTHKNSSKLFLNLYEENIVYLNNITNKIIETKTLSEEDKVKLIYDNQDKLYEFNIIVTSNFLGFLTTAMRKTNLKDSPYIKYIYQKWSNDNLNLYLSPSGAYIIEAHIYFLGLDEFILHKLNEWTKVYQYNMPKEATYIFTALRKEKKLTSEPVVQSFIKYYDEGNITTLNNAYNKPDFSFIANSYLKNRCKETKIPKVIINWINKYGLEDNATYVIQPYFRSNGALEPIKGIIVEWINENPTIKEKTYTSILQRYLNYNGDFSLIEESVKTWLNLNLENKNFSPKI